MGVSERRSCIWVHAGRSHAKLRPKLDSVAHEQGVLGHLQQGPLEQDNPGVTE